jgi:AcrR family transcriptional regulator
MMARVSGENSGRSGEDPGAGEGPRDRLLDAAIRLLEEGGPEALQARKLAAQIGASTMAVYTHFGGMGQLINAIAREGFARLSRRLEQVPLTDDPVADLFELGLAYRDHARDAPQVYRVMFGVTAPGGHRLTGKDLTTNAADTAERVAAFAHLVNAVSRIIGVVDTDEEPTEVAAQVWSAIHGYVLLEIAGYFGHDGRGLTQVLLPLGIKLVTGGGHPTEAVLESARIAAARRRG